MIGIKEIQEFPDEKLMKMQTLKVFEDGTPLWMHELAMVQNELRRRERQGP